MPNHETNTVVITGTPANIRRFAAEAFVQPGQPWPDAPEDVNHKSIPLLLFDLVVPSPPNKEKGGCSGQHEEGVICWYQWNLEHWGTKWSAYEHSHYALRFFADSDDEATIYGRIDLRFETAWSQPTPIFDAIEERWGLTVHAVTQDEGGFPDVEYGDPYGEDVIRKVTTFEFDSWDSEVEPAEPITADENDSPLQDAGDN